MKQDILVVGGGPAGMIAALTAKNIYSDRSVAVINEIDDALIPCAIPYMVHRMSDPKNNLMPTTPLVNAGIKTVVGRTVELNTDNKTVKLESGESIEYDRIVLATGSIPVLPPIPGIETNGVFVIKKYLSAMRDLREHCHAAKNIVILGGGFIGAEFADEIGRSKTAQVHVVEMMPKILHMAFDDEFCEMIQQELIEAGVHLHLGRRALSINGEGQVRSVTIDGGEEIDADMVIVGIGGKPNTALAETGGLRISESRSIWVDDYMRTSSEHVFAVGDCALKRDFFTRKEVPVWLASTATAEARVAGTNIYGIRVLRQIQGTIAAFSTKIGDTAFASAGLTVRGCEREGFRWVDGYSVAPDRHPGNLPGASPLHVKLVFADRAGALLGGQVAGSWSVSELINAIAIGIQKKLNLRELDMIQIATHPLLTSAPTVHPLVNAAHNALSQMRQR